MPATVRHVTRINSHTTLCAARAASHAQLSSNACVNRAPARAHGTAATTTPHRRHSTRGAGASRNTIIVPESNDRHRRTPPPASYPRHRRPHREHRDRAAPVGRTEITNTSSSVPSSPSNQNPSTVVRSTRRTFRHTLDARTPFPVPVVLTSTARNPTGHGVSPNPCQETHPRERHKGRILVQSNYYSCYAGATGRHPSSSPQGLSPKERLSGSVGLQSGRQLRVDRDTDKYQNQQQGSERIHGRGARPNCCLLYTSPSPRDGLL